MCKRHTHRCMFSDHRQVSSPRGVGSGEEFEWGKSSTHRCQRRKDHWHRLSHSGKTLISDPVRQWPTSTRLRTRVFILFRYAVMCFYLIVQEHFFLWSRCFCPVWLNVLHDTVCSHNCHFINKNLSFLLKAK